MPFDSLVLPTQERLRALMGRYTTADLVNISLAEFRSRIDGFHQLVDHRMEGFTSPDKQRDLSIRFHWGHDHASGGFQLSGRMGARHLWLLSEFIDRFGALPVDLTGKSVVDIGCWTGGTSLLMAAMGASVFAIDEVQKYVNAVQFLTESFGVETITAERRSLYQCAADHLQDRFDYALFAGVLYHVSDPIIALRLVFNMLKDGGTCLLETLGTDSPDLILGYQGPSVLNTGGTAAELNRGGWNWFTPTPATLRQMMVDVGFEDVQVSGMVGDHRILAVGTRTRHVDLCRAGLSVPDIR